MKKEGENLIQISFELSYKNSNTENKFLFLFANFAPSIGDWVTKLVDQEFNCLNRG